MGGGQNNLLSMFGRTNYGGTPYGGMFPGVGQQQANPMSGLARYSPYSPLNLGVYQSPFVRTYQAPQVSFQRVAEQQNPMASIYQMLYSPGDFGGPSVGGDSGPSGIGGPGGNSGDGIGGPSGPGGVSW